MAPTKPATSPAAKMQQQIKNDRYSTSSSPEDEVLMGLVQATHAPEDELIHEFEVKPILQIIEEVMRRSTPTIDSIVQGTQAQKLDASDDKALRSVNTDMPDFLAHTISKISCEISCHCSGERDTRNNSMALLKTLSSYTWVGKVVVVLAAFAVNYGECCLLTQLHSTNPLAKSVGFLRQLPDIKQEGSRTLKPKLEALTDFYKALFDLIKSIIEFYELPSQYFTPTVPVYQTANAQIPTKVYYIIESIVDCAPRIMNFMSLGPDYQSPNDAWQLSICTLRIKNLHMQLTDQLFLCRQHIGKKIEIDEYQALVRLFQSTPHFDNTVIMKRLFVYKEDKPALYDVKKMAHEHGIDVLRMKTVLLFISDFEVSHEGGLSILMHRYAESRQKPERADSHYEVVWLPVSVDKSTPWNEVKKKHFEDTRVTYMRWYTVADPSLVDGAVIRYINEEWKFNKKPLLVVIDPHGKPVNYNAFHMMSIWGNSAFPFTKSRETDLWNQELTLKIEFVVEDSIEPMILRWMSEEKFVCLYGGDNLEWIRNFTTLLKSVAKAANIPLEMLYVGKSKPTNKVGKINDTIIQEKISSALPDIAAIWWFWSRIESMWHSKVKIEEDKKAADSDPIMKDILSLLSFDCSSEGWALISKGSSADREVAKAKGDIMTKTFVEYKEWQERAEKTTFIFALNEYLIKLHSRDDHHCNYLTLPETGEGIIPDKVACIDCNRPMEKYITYRCCTD
ncbi:protein SIEVE ELEMENT OCCLUSION B-like isoform X2 [Cornus florida]|uniref:protein SIEVE ELEMENT OCCLUSION B-like isoform X2 n=1 Tax=Cornus florida TaxID=4283 RepID=UPI00289E385C|nr:protein SIEVE ELEMENT OCCLUSION B-like isoform X2 [Cornus florida]